MARAREDADASILARARQRAADAALEIRFDEGRSTALLYADASFDVVLSTLFFHHLSDEAKRETAEEIVRVLRPGGGLPELLAGAGLRSVAVRDRVRAPTGTYEISPRPHRARRPAANEPRHVFGSSARY